MDDLGSQNFDTEGFLTAPFAVIYRWGDGKHDFGIIMGKPSVRDRQYVVHNSELMIIYNNYN